MAFANNKIAGITGITTVYTPTAGSIGMTITPTSGNDSVVDVKVEDVYMVKDLTVSSGTAATPVGGEQKVVVQDGEAITVSASTAVDVIVSYLE